VCGVNSMGHKSILIIGNYPPPFGGVPRHLEYLVPHLVQQGWDVHVLSGGDSGVECLDGFTVYKYPRAEKASRLLSSLLAHPRRSLHIRSALKAPLRDLLSDVARISFGREIIRKNKVCLIKAYNLLAAGPVGAYLSEEFGIPLVLTNFGEIHSHRSFFDRCPGLAEYICGRATRLLSCSAHCANSYRLIGMSPSVEVVYYGVDLAMFTPDNDGTEVRKRLGIGVNDEIVLFVGRMVEDMGLKTVLDATPFMLERHERAKVVLVGATGDLVPAARGLERVHEGRVFVLPDVPFPELPSYYAAASLVVAPTQGDRACSSLAALEAMATGKPVVASTAGGIPEIVTHGETGLLVSPGAATALAESVLGLLANRSRLAEMGRRCRCRAESMFSTEKTNARMAQIFQEICGE